MRRADQAVIDQVADTLAVLADPDRWPALQAAWEAQNQDSTPDVSREIAALEREIATAQGRLARAAALLVDGTLDRLGYEALRDRETGRIKAAETERRRLHSTPRRQALRTLPSLCALLERAGSWSRIVREVEVGYQRAILDELVDRVVVRRHGYRTYGASIVWTPLGEALRSTQAAAA